MATMTNAHPASLRMMAYLGRDLLAQSPIAQGQSFAELNGMDTGRRQDIYLGPLERSPPAYWPKVKLFLTAVVVVVGGAGILAGGLTVWWVMR